jgi:glycosyltransferase 2 family protein
MGALREASSKKPWLRLVVGTAISALCLWLIFRQVKLDELRVALARLQWQFVAFGMVSLAAGYALRIQRWAVMLRAGGAQVGGSACAAPFLGSITLNNVLPFRAGDLIRALIFPAALGVRRVTAAASLLLERLVDLLTLLLCLGIGLSLNAQVNMPEWLGRVAVTLSLVGGTVLFGVVAFSAIINRWIASMRQWIERRGHARAAMALEVAGDLVDSLGAMSRPVVLLSLLALSMLVWVGEAGLFLALLHGLNIDAGMTSALMIMAIATLSTLMPSSPGYVGPFHLATFSAVTMLGGSSSQAAAFAVLVHLSLWLPTTVAGGIAILANPGLFKGRNISV